MNGKKRVLMCCSDKYEMGKLADVICEYLGYETFVPTYKIREDRLYEAVAKIEEEYEIPDGMVICFPNEYHTDKYDRWIFVLKKIRDYYTIFDWRERFLNLIDFPRDCLQTYFKTGNLHVYEKTPLNFTYNNLELTEEDKNRMINEYVETQPGIQMLLEKTVREWLIVVKLEKIGREVNWINFGIRDKNYQRIEELEDWIIEELCEQKQ